MKSLVMVADGKPVLALLRGDHQLSEAKLSELLGDPGELRAAYPAEIQDGSALRRIVRSGGVGICGYSPTSP